MNEFHCTLFNSERLNGAVGVVSEDVGYASDRHAGNQFTRVSE